MTNAVTTLTNSLVKNFKTAATVCVAGAALLTIVEVGKSLINK